MIRSLYYTQDGHIHTDLAVEDFQSALQDAHSLLWVDFQGNPPEEDEPILRNIFGFHLWLSTMPYKSLTCLSWTIGELSLCSIAFREFQC